MLGVFLNCEQIPTTEEIGDIARDEFLKLVEPPPEPDPLAPDSPVGVVVNSGDSSIIVSWPNVADATSYNIYYSTTQGVYDTIIQSVTSPYSNGAVNGDTYYYVVTATNSVGESGYSSEASATAGLIDNMNGSITVMSDNLTWAKCDQTNSSGANAYNQSNNDCSSGSAAMLQYCSYPYFECDDGYRLVNSSSEVYNTCMMLQIDGAGWRVPTANELHSLHDIYIDNRSLWPGLFADYHWATDSYLQEPYYAHVAVDLNSNHGITPAVANQLLRYVICVK